MTNARGYRRKQKPRGASLAIRLDAPDLEALDRWIRRSGGHDERADAIVELLRIALAVNRIDAAGSVDKSPLGSQLKWLRTQRMLNPDDFRELFVEKLHDDSSR